MKDAAVCGGFPAGGVLRLEVVVLLGLLCTSGNGAGAARPAPGLEDPRPASNGDDRLGHKRCESAFPFEARFLPKGFEDRQFRGPAPGGEPPDDKGQVAVHYRGPRGKAIEIRRPGTMFSELSLAEDSPTIEVLGERTPNFGPVEPGGSRFIVQFTYASGDETLRDQCSSYSLNEYGLKLQTLKRIAESLRPS